MKLKLILLGILASIYTMSNAQNLALKTNLLYDATTTLNLGAEVALAHRWTLDVSGNLNPWSFKGQKKFKLWMVQPEARYWFCEKFTGNFIGFHLMGGEFNAGNIKLPFGLAPTLKNHRYEGWYAGAGIVYGHQWILGKHWNLEGAIGAGYDYIKYDKYKCGNCGAKEDSGHTNYWGITKLTIAIVYLF